MPGYLAFIAAAARSGVTKRQLIITSLFFVLGFSLVFVALGASATAPGQFIMQRVTMFAKIAGVALIIVGLHMMGVFRIPKRAGVATAMVVGISFAFGWAPSISPTLAAILAVASQHDSVNRGILLLSVYSVGLAIPLLLIAIAINDVFAAFSKIRRHSHAIEIISGVLMIVTGVLIFTNRLLTFNF